MYAGRPPHIHFKVWIDDSKSSNSNSNTVTSTVDTDNNNLKTVLTSQFYFAEDNTGKSEPLVLHLDEVVVGNAVIALVANKTVVIDLGGGGNGAPSPGLTPSDMEGPFYPVADFFEIDNDLTSTAKTSSPALFRADNDLTSTAKTSSSTPNSTMQRPLRFQLVLPAALFFLGQCMF